VSITKDLLHREQEDKAASWKPEDKVYPFLMINSHQISPEVEEVPVPTWWSLCKKPRVLKDLSERHLPESARHRGNGHLHSFAEKLPTGACGQDTILLVFAKEINVHDELIEKKVLIPCHTELMLDYGHAMHEEPYPQKKRKRKND
jgi:hypothetical protein